MLTSKPSDRRYRVLETRFSDSTEILGFSYSMASAVALPSVWLAEIKG